MASSSAVPTAVLYGQGTLLTGVGVIALLWPDIVVQSEEDISAGSPMALQIKIMRYEAALAFVFEVDLGLAC
ncbi:hypothetical protein LTR17_004058 [Elasticomyces elasticus]|nr:hypothetical protein LTR17_004058 [Elasticomyces elasticus]